MAFIMRVLKNARPAVCLCLLGWLITVTASAQTVAVTVENAVLHRQDERYLLSADVHYQLSGKAIEALHNGIPLFWAIRVKILEKRQLLWNKSVAEDELRFRIQYHALLNMYRIHNENSGEVYNYTTLPAALDQMSSIRNIPFFRGLTLDPTQKYQAAIKVYFDRESLPLPLRPIAYLNPQWYLSSDWYVWPLTK